MPGMTTTMKNTTTEMYIPTTQGVSTTIEPYNQSYINYLYCHPGSLRDHHLDQWQFDQWRPFIIESGFSFGGAGTCCAASTNSSCGSTEREDRRERRERREGRDRREGSKRGIISPLEKLRFVVSDRLCDTTVSGVA
jgi:hypothetical protein